MNRHYRGWFGSIIKPLSKAPAAVFRTCESKWRYIMQKINLRDLYPDVYKTDVFVDVAEEVLATIRGQQQNDAA